MPEVGSPFPGPARKLADPRDAERRASRWLVIGIVVLAPAVAWRGRFEPRLSAETFSSDDALLSGQRLDPNTASWEELVAVPGVSARLASAMVSARADRPFWSVDDLDRVAGVGPGVLPELAIWLDTGLVGPAPETRRIDLNEASEAELDRLPGIGPALAARIVEDRESRGPFRKASDLDRVKGIGPAKMKALQTKVLPP